MVERRCKLSTIMLETQPLIMFGTRPTTIKVIIFNQQHLVTWILIFVDLLEKALYVVNKKAEKIYIGVLVCIISIIPMKSTCFPITRCFKKWNAESLLLEIKVVTVQTISTSHKPVLRVTPGYDTITLLYSQQDVSPEPAPTLGTQRKPPQGADGECHERTRNCYLLKCLVVFCIERQGRTLETWLWILAQPQKHTKGCITGQTTLR